MQRYYNSEQIRAIYDKMSTNIEKLRSISSTPLTLSEKIIAGHMNYDSIATYTTGKDYIFLKPDRVALQDVTGQMVILQFMQSGLTDVSIPTTVHCDHLIQARTSASDDTKHSLYENNEIYQFLESSCRKYGIGFWKPGAGIIHQVLLENYSFPGGLMIGTDSHTPNAGGLGMLAIGVGGIDASEVMAGFDWEVLLPKRIGVHLTGELSGWCSAKDIILYLASILTVSGGTNSIIEYFGPGTKSISCTGKATITNMGAELGATSSLFPFDDSMIKYLKITNRQYISDIAEKYLELLCADSDIEKNPNKYFDKIDWVFHLAGLADIVPSIDNPTQYFNSNVKGTLNILESSRRANIKKLIYAASASCYGIPDKYPTNENSKINPQYPYALTKLIGEQLIFHWFKVYNMPNISLRFFNAYGPKSRTTGAYGAVFGVFLAQKLAGKPLTIVGDGNQTRDFIHVYDLVDAIIKAAQKGKHGETYNVGNGKETSVNLIANIIGGIKVHVPKRPGEPDRSMADITKIKKQFNVGDIIETEIVNKVDFGIFVKVFDEIDGMVHVSDLTWDENKNASVLNSLNKGQKIKVKILETSSCENVHYSDGGEVPKKYVIGLTKIQVLETGIEGWTWSDSVKIESR